MPQFKLLGGVLVLATAITTPLLAQEVVYEPGYCAQYYPNANCQNIGPGNPLYGGYQRAGAPAIQASSTGGSSACLQYRSYDPASGTYIGRNGRRVACQ